MQLVTAGLQAVRPVVPADQGAELLDRRAAGALEVAGSNQVEIPLDDDGVTGDLLPVAVLDVLHVLDDVVGEPAVGAVDVIVAIGGSGRNGGEVEHYQSLL